jgi:hypothetical protein
LMTMPFALVPSCVRKPRAFSNPPDDTQMDYTIEWITSNG